jgi:hypothetical protein
MKLSSIYFSRVSVLTYDLGITATYKSVPFVNPGGYAFTNCLLSGKQIRGGADFCCSAIQCIPVTCGLDRFIL